MVNIYGLWASKNRGTPTVCLSSYRTMRLSIFNPNHPFRAGGDPPCLEPAIGFLTQQPWLIFSVGASEVEAQTGRRGGTRKGGNVAGKFLPKSMAKW